MHNTYYKIDDKSGLTKFFVSQLVKKMPEILLTWLQNLKQNIYHDRTTT